MSSPGSQPVSSPPCTPPAIDATAWFKSEVQPHDAKLKNYLRGKFPGVRDVDDIVQESYLKIWQVKALKPIHSARSFLYTIARHLALDFVRRERRSPVSTLGDLAALNALDDRPSVVDTLTQQEKILILSQAVASLPDRCREIIILHKIKGLPQAEVARQLNLTLKTIENQVGRGVKRCEEFFRERGIERF